MESLTSGVTTTCVEDGLSDENDENDARELTVDR